MRRNKMRCMCRRRAASPESVQREGNCHYASRARETDFDCTWLQPTSREVGLQVSRSISTIFVEDNKTTLDLPR